MYDYNLFDKKSLRSFSSSSSKFNQTLNNFSSTANTSKNDSLILPYYQSDKWVKLLKKKVSNIANEYNEFLNFQYEKIKNKANFNKNKNFNLDNNNNINFPLIEYKNINIENNKDNNNNNIFEQNIYEPGMKFEEINKLQKCSLQKMFPKFRNKTQMNFYSAKNRNAKMKKISLFDNNNHLNINNTNNKEEGIQAKTFYINKELLKKQQYIDYIKQKSENDYMKFYYNCYG